MDQETKRKISAMEREAEELDYRGMWVAADKVYQEIKELEKQVQQAG